MNRGLIALFTWLTLSAAFMGLAGLLQAGDWQIHLVVLTAVTTAVTWGITGVGRSLPRLAGVVAVVVSILVWIGHLCLVAGDGLGIAGVIITPEAWEAILTNFGEAIDELPNYSRPASEPWLFFPLALVGLGPMAIAGAWLALGLRRPQWVGVLILACWAVFFVGKPSMGMGWALVTGAAYLLLLSLSPWKARQARGLKPMAPLIVVPCVVAGLLVSMAGPVLPGWGQSRSMVGLWMGSYSDMTGLNANGPISVGDSLRTQSNVILFRTQGEYAGPVKMGTLYDFDGSVWQPAQGWEENYLPGRTVGDVFYRGDPDDVGMYFDPNWFGPPEPWQPGPVMTVEIEQLSGRVLPTAVGPRGVSNIPPGRYLTYDPNQDSIYTNVNLAPGLSYQVDTMAIDRAVLSAMVKGAGNALVDLDQVSEHAGQIRVLAAWITQHTDNTYDAILTAIQDYLAGSSFTYTLTPMWEDSGDPVWDFLENKEGYCVHYATAMAVLASALGIQMRVSVGYLPGEVDEDGWRTVRGSNAHMWPEAYFPGIGWIGYEPTPSIGVGAAVTSEATPEPSAAPSLEVEPTLEATQAPQPDPVLDPPTPGNTLSWSAVMPWLAGAGLVLGLLGIALLVRVLAIRRYGAERAFQRIFAQGLKAGILKDGMSVRTVVATLGAYVPAITASELEVLRGQVEASRYGPPGWPVSGLAGRDLWRLKNETERLLRS